MLPALAYARRSWRVFGSGAIADAYAIGGASPELVAAFLTAADGTTAGEYYRKAGSETTFGDLFTHSVSGLLTMFDSSGTLCWNPHNHISGTTLVTAGYPTTGWYVPSPQTYGVTDFLGGTTAMTITNSYTQHIPTGTPVDGAKYRMSFVMKLGTQPHGVLAACRLKNSGTAEYIAFNATTGNPQNVDPDYDDSGMTDLGDGWWYCWADMTATSSGNFFMLLRADDLFTATWDGSATFCHPSIRRIDLPMADNPDTPTLSWFVPNTTGAAKYLPRRQAYRYNSGWELAGMQMEAAAATNALTYSRGFTTGWASSGTPTVTLDETGIDGVANTAATVTCDDATGYEYIYSTVTCSDDSNPSAAGIFVKYDASFSGAYPVIGLYFLGGTTVTTRIVFDPSDGSYVNVNAPTSVRVVRWSAGWWYVELVATNNSTGNTSCRLYVWPGASVNGSTLNTSGTGSVVVDQAQIELGKSITSSPIITTGSTVTRAAETLSIAAANLPITPTEYSFSAKTLLTRTNNPEMFHLGAGSFWHRVYPRSDIATRIQSYGGGGKNWQATAGSPIANGINVPFNFAVAMKANDTFQLAVNGESGTATVTTDIYDISTQNMNLPGTTPPNGPIFFKELRVWSTKLPEADLVTAGTAS